jgi:phosphinothricin acetyltransferase
LNIRVATEEDGEAIAAIYRPIVADTVITFETVPPDGVEMTRRIIKLRKTHPWLVCERERRVVGYAYASPHHERAAYQWSVNTSVYVHADARRIGIGRALYEALFQLLVAQGFVNAYAGITLPNPGSVVLHEALGFRPLCVYPSVGFKLGAWHDVGWWHRLIRPVPTSPRPPSAPIQVLDHS